MLSTEIVYVCGRCRTTEYVYDVIADGEVVAAASTYTGGDSVAQEVASWHIWDGWEADPPAPEPNPLGDEEGDEAPEWNRPLLAQCAHAIRAVLGNVPAAGGIIDELRRCDAALKEQGW